MIEYILQEVSDEHKINYLIKTYKRDTHIRRKYIFESEAKATANACVQSKITFLKL